MQKCIIHHTGVDNTAHGVLKDQKVYLLGKDNNLYFPEEMFMAREECEGGLIQFEIEGKWGFADIFTGKIAIEPTWDYAGPFYRGYAHVVLGVQLASEGYSDEKQGGQHGYIDSDGKIIIPLEYDDAEEIPYRKYFMVAKNKRWGLIDIENESIIPFLWDYLQTNYKHNLIFCGIKEKSELHVGDVDKLCSAIIQTQLEPTCEYILKWGVYDENFNLIVHPELDTEPIRPQIKSSPRSKSFSYYDEHYILKREEGYGVLCNDGRLIANIELSKKQATLMINSICQWSFQGNLYI
ncbi:KWG Leptospira repeat protein [Alkaliphilus metalliredigens QYMF]|uniref:KWG Leptospira repeat protein n=1 Tax=Alkaliphilus metalliredigens (strain QYMF) TaxID=293826 RepID=A6TST9_ALKMQ|nr:WG repeat-containing protein [Alkaliphilus metalliredigens]ABR49257.1 KWG Leptospira repeat protein [Alkaliphilus metalliredigens QYMF]